ncbi:unnamed protein product, partial [Soboliphyme baturini]|uniref:Kelch repeat protein n=1 Tax=Soboliphyme baturini TaxID=241478 RepID=A0A183IX40_9BILA
IYVVGGYDGTSRQKAVIRYDPRVGQWQSVEPMINPRSNFGIAVIDNDQILVAGGYNGVTTVALCELYEPRVECWQRLPPMRISRSALYCASIKGVPNIDDFIDKASRIACPSQIPWNR